MKTGRYFISTGFSGSNSGHFLIAVHSRWRVGFVRPAAKPDYRRLYVGPFEFEWSRPTLNHLTDRTTGRLQ